jgi:hypothetical protein
VNFCALNRHTCLSNTADDSAESVIGVCDGQGNWPKFILVEGCLFLALIPRLLPSHWDWEIWTQISLHNNFMSKPGLMLCAWKCWVYLFPLDSLERSMGGWSRVLWTPYSIFWDWWQLISSYWDISWNSKISTNTSFPLKVLSWNKLRASAAQKSVPKFTTFLVNVS